MDQKAVRAGAGSGIIAILLGAALGTFGGWEPLFGLATTEFGSWILILVLSVLSAFVYGYWFNAFLPGTEIIRGATFGVLVWILMLILGGVSDFFKAAAYPDPAGPTVFLTLVLHAVWGSILGILYESR